MKKKVLLSIVIMLLIIVTGCGKSNEVGNKSSKEEYKTLSETYVFSTDKNKSITMKVTVPNNEKYELTKVRPKYYKSYSGNIFLDGDKIIISCGPVSYMIDSMVKSYTEMKDKMLTDKNNQQYHIEEVEFGKRKAIKMDLIDKSDNNKLYGYSYKVSIDDIDSTSYAFIRVLNNKIDSISTDKLYEDEEVKKIIDSIEFEK